MKRFAIFLLFAAACFAACGSDDTLSEGENTGISDHTWDAEVRSRASGQTHTFSFRAAGSWQAVSDAAWCSVSPGSGAAGQRMLNVVTTENGTGARRTTDVAVYVAGYSMPAIFRITQQAEEGDYSQADEWMYDYMKECYLWNEPLADFEPDYGMGYEAFLQSMLNFVATRKDGAGRPLNYDDGHWADGKRKYFYSYVLGPDPDGQSRAATRSVGDEVTETGLHRLAGASLEGVSEMGIVVFSVAPGTSADRAGLRRGMFITEVGGRKVTMLNYAELMQQLYYGTSVRVLPNRVILSEGKIAGLEPLPEVTISSEKFVDPAIYRSEMLTVGGKKVAYLLYMGFDSLQDRELIAAFEGFRGAEELILDLRYNSGGSVRSSTLLATLIVGDAFKDEVYCRMTYNAQRMKREEAGVYRIGSNAVPDGNGVYQPIADGLGSALGLKRIYVICSESAASASKLIINGLRGMGVEVRLIGMRTNGKNVGMEGFVDYIVDNEPYTFMPITFYSENREGFRDYSDGFVPDVEFDDSAMCPGDFATEQDWYYALAAYWIEKDRMPVISYPIHASARTRSVVGLLPDPAERPARLGGSIVFRER
ncbi:MAG: S41 family peptidase [Alistipes sp.]|nr:S41 family peptidase [Alistipes senegalensis]MCM1250632.1 S41 family peptidase [Alistipes sp.]